MTLPLAVVARRFADQTSDRINGVPADSLWVLSVTAVEVGASAGGNAVVTLSWRGSSITANDYCASYTPTVGDRVLCALLSDHQLVVIDRLAG